MFHCSSTPCSIIPLLLFHRSSTPVPLFLYSCSIITSTSVPLFLYFCSSIPLLLYHYSSTPSSIIAPTSVPLFLYFCSIIPLLRVPVLAYSLFQVDFPSITLIINSNIHLSVSAYSSTMENLRYRNENIASRVFIDIRTSIRPLKS